MSNTPLRAEDVKAHNLNIILSQFFSVPRKTVSQSELVEKTGLKATSVFRIFTLLEEDGWIRPVNDNIARKKNGKGRRPNLFEICPSKAYTIGLDFLSSSMSLGVFDLTGERVHSINIEFPPEIDIEAVHDLIVAQIKIAIKILNLDNKKIIGIGIGAPGKVNVKEGKVIFYSRIPGLKNFPLKDKLEKEIDIPVLVHNNCSTSSYYLYKYHYHNTGSLFTFLLRTGINGSLVDNDELLLDCNNETIEVGHLPISIDGPACTCGGKGCLQALIKNLDYTANSNEDILFKNLSLLLETGDQKAEETIAKAARLIFQAMKIIDRIFCPSAYVLLCATSAIGEKLKYEIRSLYAKNPDLFSTNPPGIFHDVYDSYYSQKGASELVLDEYFSR